MGFFGWGNRSLTKQGTARNRLGAKRRLGIETFEPRLTMSWGGVPPSIVSPVGAVAITYNTANQAAGSASISRGEVDYYTFIAPKTGTYTLSTAASIDTVLGVYNGSGQRLAYNDDISSSNLASRTTANLTAGQRYYVGITNYTGSANGNYSWNFIGPAATPVDDSYENNDTLSSATNLGSVTASRTISNLVMADAHDYYSFTLAAAGDANSYVSTSFNTSQGNLDLRLLNSSGQQLGISQSATNSERISLQGLAAGTYVVDVYGVGGVFNPNYSLVVAPPATTAPPTSSGAFDIQLVTSGLTASQQAIFDSAVARWEQIITGDLPNASYNGVAVDDLLIHASISPIDGVGNILGQAGPDAFRSGTMIPYHGEMEFDSADVAAMQADGSLYSVIVHEIGHILGLGTIWSNRGLVSGAGTSNPIYTGAQATAAYNAIFGTNAAGVPVENTGGSGTRDSHWRESVLSSEVMTGYAGPGTNLPISRITVGALADLGYAVNVNAADNYVRPGSTSSLSSATSSTAPAIVGSVSSTSVGSRVEQVSRITAADLAFWNWQPNVSQDRRLAAVNSAIEDLLAALL